MGGRGRSRYSRGKGGWEGQDSGTDTGGGLLEGHEWIRISKEGGRSGGGGFIYGMSCQSLIWVT